MSEYAAPDYEPNGDDVATFLLETFPENPPPGSHGSCAFIPAFERYIWMFPVFWGHREVDSNGHIRFSWCVPAPCPKDRELTVSVLKEGGSY